MFACGNITLCNSWDLLQDMIKKYCLLTYDNSKYGYMFLVWPTYWHFTIQYHLAHFFYFSLLLFRILNGMNCGQGYHISGELGTWRLPAMQAVAIQVLSFTSGHVWALVGRSATACQLARRLAACRVSMRTTISRSRIEIVAEHKMTSSPKLEANHENELLFVEIGNNFPNSHPFIQMRKLWTRKAAVCICQRVISV